MLKERMACKITAERMKLLSARLGGLLIKRERRRRVGGMGRVERSNNERKINELKAGLRR